MGGLVANRLGWCCRTKVLLLKSIKSFKRFEQVVVCGDSIFFFFSLLFLQMVEKYFESLNKELSALIEKSKRIK